MIISLFVNFFIILEEIATKHVFKALFLHIPNLTKGLYCNFMHLH